LTAPCASFFTLPFRTFRALIFMAYLLSPFMLLPYHET
jgi:hypothetical protein